MTQRKQWMHDPVHVFWHLKFTDAFGVCLSTLVFVGLYAFKMIIMKITRHTFMLQQIHIMPRCSIDFFLCSRKCISYAHNIWKLVSLFAWTINEKKRFSTLNMRIIRTYSKRMFEKCFHFSSYIVQFYRFAHAFLRMYMFDLLLKYSFAYFQSNKNPNKYVIKMLFSHTKNLCTQSIDLYFLILE